MFAVFRKDKPVAEPVGSWAGLSCPAWVEPFAPWPAAGARDTTTDFEVGVLLPSAVLSSGTSTFVSGKYVAQQPAGTSYSTTMTYGIRLTGTERLKRTLRRVCRSSFAI